MHFMQIVFSSGPENDEKCPMTRLPGPQLPDVKKMTAKRFLDLSPEGQCDAFLDFIINVCLWLCEARWGTGGDVIFSTFGA